MGSMAVCAGTLRGAVLELECVAVINDIIQRTVSVYIQMAQLRHNSKPSVTVARYGSDVMGEIWVNRARLGESVHICGCDNNGFT